MCNNIDVYVRDSITQVPGTPLLLTRGDLGLAGVGRQAGLGPGAAELVDAGGEAAARQAAVVGRLTVERSAQTVH